MNDFFDAINDLIGLLSGEQAIWASILAVLIFALGVIVGWIVQGSKTRRYKKELLLLRKDRDEYEVRYRAGETKQKALERELEALSREKVAALDKLQTMEATLAEKDASLQYLQMEKENLSQTNQDQAGTIAALQAQLNAAATAPEPTPRSIEAPAGSPGAAAGASNGQGSNDSLNAYILTSEQRFQQLEQRLASLQQENEGLRQSSAASSNPYTGHQPVMDPSLGSGGGAEPLVIRADTTDPGVRTGNQGETQVIVQTTPSVHIPVISQLDPNHHDDLTAIHNIGPFLQGKLNEADIYSYEQIANWTESDIITYTELIGYIPGIIQRDDWVGQAKALAAGHQVQPEVPTAREITDAAVPTTDDTPLTIVEGIGPKIASVLQAAGISSLSVLADTPAERLREILADAGSRFKSHDPKTWPVQAGLAADGKLKELKAWQQELKGGM